MWSQEDIQKLKDNYPIKPCEEILKIFPNRTWDSIRVAASRFKIKRANFKYKFSTGNNNPKYKDGRANKIYYCKCGNERDQRAKECIKCRNFTPELSVITSIIEQSKSYLEVAEKLNEDRQTVTRFIRKHKINIGHFKAGRDRLDAPDKILCLSDKLRRGTVRQTIIGHKLLPYQCQKCNMLPEWHNEILTLELDHINGNPYDNRIENLRFLCPNCHSQTTTSKGKNCYGTTKRKK